MGIGQDSHRFVAEDVEKDLVLGGYTLPGEMGMEGNSDADILLHSLCNAISSVTGVIILGKIADQMCAAGITDSSRYLEKALETLENNPGERRFRLDSIAFTIEGKKPKLLKHIESIRHNIADLCGLSIHDVGITATTGEGLTDFGKGLGLQAFCYITCVEED